MNSRLIGGFLILSPIIAFAMFAVVPDTGDMTPAQSLEKLLENKTVNLIGVVIGTLAFGSVMLSHSLLARSMRGTGKPGASCAELAGIILLLMIPVLLVGTGYFLAALDKAGTDKVLAEAILTNGEGVGNILGIPWTIGFALMGTAIILQKKFHIAVGVLAVALPAIGFVIEIGEIVSDSNAIEAIGFAAFMGMLLLTVTMGILTLIRKEG